MTALSDALPLGDAELTRVEYGETGHITALEAEDHAGKVLRIEFAPSETEDFTWPARGVALPLPARRPKVTVSVRWR